eukprot:2227542-Rhodomonas_salina.3
MCSGRRGRAPSACTLLVVVAVLGTLTQTQLPPRSSPSPGWLVWLAAARIPSGSEAGRANAEAGLHQPERIAMLREKEALHASLSLSLSLCVCVLRTRKSSSGIVKRRLPGRPTVPLPAWYQHTTRQYRTLSSRRVLPSRHVGHSMRARRSIARASTGHSVAASYWHITRQYRTLPSSVVLAEHTLVPDTPLEARRDIAEMVAPAAARRCTPGSGGTR